MQVLAEDTRKLFQLRMSQSLSGSFFGSGPAAAMRGRGAHPAFPEN
jgi:hypothetical protein